MESPNSVIKALIHESKKIRGERGENLFSRKSLSEEELGNADANKSLKEEKKGELDPNQKINFKNLRDSHVRLAHLSVEFDKLVFLKMNPQKEEAKKRSKSIHLYVDEELESFLRAETQKASTYWGLRKNAGLGSLIQHFVKNFKELKLREEKQLQKLLKMIGDFKLYLVEFKKYSQYAGDYALAEKYNQKLKNLSSDLAGLLSLLEFTEESLRRELKEENYSWLAFMLKWEAYQ